MSRQHFCEAKSTLTSFDMMVAWQASGGAVEALADLGHEAAGTARGRQGGVSGDDGLRASGPSVQFPCHGDDGLQATMTTALASCGVAEGGLAASRPTLAFPYCADDGLQAFELTTGVHAC